jgi:branched-chain amino acid transport system substrate-binding protein
MNARLGKRLRIALAAPLCAILGTAAIGVPALAQNEQFIPQLVYRTGAYAPNGIPFANGIADYYTLVNERDGGINGVKIVFEECEFGYATDRGIECYERLKSKGPTGASYVLPNSTGVTFALTEKAPVDKIPIISMGYGRSESRDGSVFQWNFPLHACTPPTGRSRHPNQQRQAIAAGPQHDGPGHRRRRLYRKPHGS